MEEQALIILRNLPYLIAGSFETVAIVIGSLTLGFILGVPMAVAQVYSTKPIQKIIGLYVWFFRGTPILVQLFLFYFGLFNFLGINLSAFTASCIVLGMTSASYQSQIFRGSILSLPQGQLKAAKALGMSDKQAICNIILPQALRFSIPAWSNEFSILLKDSALAFALGTPELMARTHFIATRTYMYLPFYITAGIIYLIITLIGLKALRLLERKVYIPGYQTN